MTTLRKRKGFTLIELIVSIALVGILFITVLNAMDTGLLNIVRAGSRTKNTVVAGNNIIVSPIAISESTTIDVELPYLIYNPDNTVSEDTVIVPIPGSFGKGIGNVDDGFYGNVNVEIEAFIPYLPGLEPAPSP